MQIVIKNKEGVFTTVLYDDEDHGLLSGYKWYITRAGYAASSYNIGGKRGTILMHRVILSITDPKIKTDHINHNRADNRRLNIRPCTMVENARNKTGWGFSVYLGVSAIRSKRDPSRIISFQAQININGERAYLGRFKTEELAAKAYDNAAKEHHKGFANLNFK